MTAHDKKLEAAEIQKRWVKNIIFIFLMGAVLFLASGKLNWHTAWVYLGCIFAVVIANALAMDPSLLVERSERQEGTKKWDVLLASFVGIFGPLLIWLIAGLDIRFGWSGGISLVIKIVGFGFVLLGGLLGTWSMAAKRFFSATVRIQTDRDHSVISQGPYRFIRHPGYAGGMISMLASPLALGSWVAFVPAALAACGYIVRTYLEDKTPQAELEGYNDYTKRVQYRLFHGVW